MSTHHSDTALFLPAAAFTSSHNVCLVYDNVICESNPRRLFKLHFQATYLKDFLSLKRFQFVYCLYNKDDYVVDWELTWFALNFSPAHDASFQASHTARHYTFKFKLFLDDLPFLEKLKVTRSDLYIDFLTCHSYRDRMEDLMHLILCSRHRSTISSSNWSSYALIWGCLPTMFIDLFVDLSIPRQSAMKVVAAIHNNFIQKLRKHIWNPRTYDKSKWEDAMNITLKLKTSPQHSNLPATSYVPFTSLPPPTHLVIPRDSNINWIKDSMTQGWDVDFYSGRVICYYVSIVAFTLLSLSQGLVRASTNVMEPPTSESLDSLTALVTCNRTKANKLRNDLKKCCKLLSKLAIDLSIVFEPATYTQLITNVATLSRMILDSSFSLAACRQQIATDKLRLAMWTRDPDLSIFLSKIFLRTPQNVARRGGSFPNTNSKRANRHFKRNNNNISNNSSSDDESATQQKRTRTISKITIDEDFVTDAAANVGVDSTSSPPKENNTASTSLSSPLNNAAASSTPNNDTSRRLNVSMYARTMTPASPLNTSSDKATADDPPVDQFPIPSPTFSFDRNDYQAAAAPNSAPETLKNFPTNKALIDAVNNTFIEMYKSYTGKARMTGSGDAKRLVIHFQTATAHDACVTDISFFFTKDNILSYFKKFGNIASCRVYSRKNAKVQQVRIVYDSAQLIARFDSQWAVYCFSTCLRVTPCHYTVDQKSSHCAFVAMLTELPPNTKDINLALLIRELGAKAVNVPLSLNSYKPKRWAYITFPSQKLMDAAMEQLISFNGYTLQWNLPDNTNKLCH
ncbi:hypothetical protein RclHR1_20250008 [Rhizophagus clarus]|uniref:RRM domain-containing protein n=1 Tax=Rhizophagus clarus TaxID=94130 RepID=A0A2Z6QR97_9GLOM|nr:hypothetical protein RclHR1_20250008 [Rhizophagus clarus]